MAMSRFEAEPRATRPTAYAGWQLELEQIADEEGMDLFWCAWAYSPAECCRHLESLPGVLPQLIARAKWSDACAGRRDLRRVS